MFDDAPQEPPTAWAVPGVPRQRPTAEPAPRVLALRKAVDDAAGLELTRLDPAALLASCRELLRLAQRTQLLALAALGEVHETGAVELDGAASTARWVQGLQVGADRTTVAVARRLRAHPEVAAAVLSGRIGLGAATSVQAALARVRPHLDRPDGLLDGHPAEDALAAVLLDGVPMLLAQARGGFPASDDPVLVEIARALPEILDRPVSQLDRLEAGLVQLARHAPAGRELTGALGLLVDALLPEQHDDRADAGHHRRGLRLTRKADGSGWRVEGDLDLACGEKLFTLLVAELHRDPDAAQDTARAAALRDRGLDPHDPYLREHPDLQPARSGEVELAGPAGPSTSSSTSATDDPVELPDADELDRELIVTARGAQIPRTDPQRLHDALDAVCDRHLAAGLGGTVDRQPVQVLVTVTPQTLEDAPGALPGLTATGTPLPRRLVRRWTCGAAITRFVLDLRGKVLAASHTQRTLTPTERRALHLQTGGRCQNTGCTRGTRDPGLVLHPHHATAYSRSSTTSLTDTVHLCTHCHHDLHDRQRTLHLKDGRRLGPDGWVT